MVRQFEDVKTAGVSSTSKTRSTANSSTSGTSLHGMLHLSSSVILSAYRFLISCYVLLEHTYKTLLKQLHKFIMRRSAQSSYLRSRRTRRSPRHVQHSLLLRQILFQSVWENTFSFILFLLSRKSRNFDDTLRVLVPLSSLSLSLLLLRIWLDSSMRRLPSLSPCLH